jgi:hypothetical protein
MLLKAKALIVVNALCNVGLNSAKLLGQVGSPIQDLPTAPAAGEHRA